MKQAAVLARRYEVEWEAENVKRESDIEKPWKGIAEIQ
jgi:hypothetical protein